MRIVRSEYSRTQPVESETVPTWHVDDPNEGVLSSSAGNLSAIGVCCSWQAVGFVQAYKCNCMLTSIFSVLHIFKKVIIKSEAEENLTTVRECMALGISCKEKYRRASEGRKLSFSRPREPALEKALSVKCYF
jgi:hypothetical protein